MRTKEYKKLKEERLYKKEHRQQNYRTGLLWFFIASGSKNRG